MPVPYFQIIIFKFNFEFRTFLQLHIRHTNPSGLTLHASRLQPECIKTGQSCIKNSLAFGLTTPKTLIIMIFFPGI
jgi:hypothetical protein